MQERGLEAVGSHDSWGGGLSNDQAVEELLSTARRFYFSKDYLKAAATVARAIERSPDDAELWNTCGVFLRAGDRSTEAVWSYRQSLARRPLNAGAWSNLGNALVDLKQLETGMVCHRRALALEPDNVEFHRNLARAQIVANHHAEAVQTLNRALRLQPSNFGARFDRAMASLHLADYVRGWSDYETRLQNTVRSYPGRRWNGEPFQERTLLITCEQGHGDAIWAARYFRMVKALGGTLIVECHEGLVSLFSTIPGVDQVVRLDDPLPRADLHCPMCSLPGLFTRDIGEIPSATYLTADGQRTAKFEPVMARAGGNLRVGIVWSGNQGFARNRDRAAPLKAFMQAFAHPGVQLFSLQKGPLEKDLKALPADAPIIDLAPFIGDFADSAAVLSMLDLVIMTDSAIAHLCGALGQPVWVLLSYEAFWLWLLDRDDSPWYPSMRFFRQKAWGDWGGVFDAASAALMQLSLAGRGAASNS
ncbi:tetratricopeptide repeat protein [Bradyrhizobium sp. HKCCYLS2038]|uniref:tetratricopeptide repeat protein n=1 Tax=unclassified Bradyrhizobium TaxID=2631580 RepID=UPI003EB9F8C8